MLNNSIVINKPKKRNKMKLINRMLLLFALFIAVGCSQFENPVSSEQDNQPDDTDTEIRIYESGSSNQGSSMKN